MKYILVLLFVFFALLGFCLCVNNATLSLKPNVLCPSCCSGLDCDYYCQYNEELCCNDGCCSSGQCHNQPTYPNCDRHTSCGQFQSSAIFNATYPLTQINNCLAKSKDSCIEAYDLQIVVSELFSPSCCLSPIKAFFQLFYEDPYTGHRHVYDQGIIDPCGSLPPCSSPIHKDLSICQIKGAFWFLQINFLDLNTTSCSNGFYFNTVLYASPNQCSYQDSYTRVMEDRLHRKGVKSPLTKTLNVNY